MTRWRMATLALATLCAAETLWLGLGDALAEVPAPAPPSVETPAATPRLTCRIFAVGLGDGATIETADRTTEIGQWVGEREAEGLLLYGVDFEVGQKSTGYPQGYVQVCMYPR